MDKKPGIKSLQLHVGAHKTASTHLQSVLRRNTHRLSEHGIGFCGPPVLSAGWTGQLHRTRRFFGGRAALRGATEQLVPDCQRLVLSDENIAGYPLSLGQDPVLYEGLSKRLKIMRGLFPTAVMRCFISIRSYADFYRSVYCELVRNRGWQPFEKHIHCDHVVRHSWARLLSRLRRVVPDVELIVWPYEEYATVLPSVLQNLLGADAADALGGDLIRTRVRPSLSAAALGALRDLGQDVRKPKERSEEMLALYPISDKYPAYDPWTREQRTVLDDNYARDLQKIARMPGVSLLGHANNQREA